jgi:hypothetical protein
MALTVGKSFRYSVKASFMPLAYRTRESEHVAEEEATKSSTSWNGCEETM